MNSAGSAAMLPSALSLRPRPAPHLSMISPELTDEGHCRVILYTSVRMCPGKKASIDAAQRVPKHVNPEL